MNTPSTPATTAYGWLMLAGILISLFLWSRATRKDSRLLAVYLGALLGGFMGAKLVYILAEGWLHFGASDVWLQLATGKTILGALLGGYLGVEIAKHWAGYSASTGDRFALIAPVGIIFGRFGCLLHGCCGGVACTPAWYTLTDIHGVARWPAVPVEILFNLVAFVFFVVCLRNRLFTNQLFHLYLIGYGSFRFAHEFLRATPRLIAGITGYQLAAAAIGALGVAGYYFRRKERSLTSVCAAWLQSNPDMPIEQPLINSGNSPTADAPQPTPHE